MKDIRRDSKKDSQNIKEINKILDEIIKKIKPDRAVIKHADEMVENINQKLKNAKIIAECVKGGSIAKDTYLKNDYDIDLFIRYSMTYKDQDISNISEKILKKLCSELRTEIERIHGSRDYFQFKIKKNNKILVFEVIPVILVHPQSYQDIQNITDMSPEHVNWVKKYTDKNPKLTDEIRLAKQFCKASKVYGAESYINGFSGHILDILVIHHGSFYNLIKTFSKYDENSLKKHIIIDTEKNLSNPLKQLNDNKITPLIIIDPIQKNRNSAAALGKEKLLMFIDAAKKFLEKPDKKSFEVETFDIDKEIETAVKRLKLQKNKYKVVKIEIDTTEGSKDVVGTKALKAYEAIVAHTDRYGFKILHSGWNFFHDEKRAEAYIILDSQISLEITQEGPPITAQEDCKKFVNKHVALGHKMLYKDSRAYTLVPRKFLDPKSFIEDLSKKEFISRKVKGIFVR